MRNYSRTKHTCFMTLRHPIKVTDSTRIGGARVAAGDRAAETGPRGRIEIALDGDADSLRFQARSRARGLAHATDLPAGHLTVPCSSPCERTASDPGS